MTSEPMKRITVTYGDDFIAEMELTYYITAKESNGIRRYGVRIVKEAIENSARVSEDNCTDCIFSTLAEVTSFLDMLIKYEVTPISLDGIVNDYLYEPDNTRTEIA